MNRLGAIGVQFEAKILFITLEFEGKNWFFVDFEIKAPIVFVASLRIHENLRIFWEEDLFLVLTSEFVEIRAFFLDEDQN